MGEDVKGGKACHGSRILNMAAGGRGGGEEERDCQNYPEFSLGHVESKKYPGREVQVRGTQQPTAEEKGLPRSYVGMGVSCI